MSSRVSAWKCILQGMKKDGSEKKEVSLYAFFTGWLSKTCGQLAKKCYKTNDMSECIFHRRKFSKKHGILLSLESWVTILKEYSKHICILDIASVASLQSAKTQFSRFLLNKVHKAMCVCFVWRNFLHKRRKITFYSKSSSSPLSAHSYWRCILASSSSSPFIVFLWLFRYMITTLLQKYPNFVFSGLD